MITILAQVFAPDRASFSHVCSQCNIMSLQCIAPRLLCASERGLAFASSFGVKVANTFIVDYLKGK